MCNQGEQRQLQQELWQRSCRLEPQALMKVQLCDFVVVILPTSYLFSLPFSCAEVVPHGIRWAFQVLRPQWSWVSGRMKNVPSNLPHTLQKSQLFFFLFLNLVLVVAWLGFGFYLLGLESGELFLSGVDILACFGIFSVSASIHSASQWRGKKQSYCQSFW